MTIISDDDNFQSQDKTKSMQKNRTSEVPAATKLVLTSHLNPI